MAEESDGHAGQVILSAELLSSVETCPRQAVWSGRWEPRKLHPTELLYRGLFAGLTETVRDDYGEVAGETVIELCADRGIATEEYDVYSVGVHHACLADILVTHLRSSTGPWQFPAPLPEWIPRCYQLSNDLVRVILVDHWNEERMRAESHSWYTLGEIAAYEMPMLLKVMVLGPSRHGRRHSPWTRGYVHRQWPQLKFKKHPSKNASKQEPFALSWEPIWREYASRFTVHEWLEAMAKDDCVHDETFNYRISVPASAKLRDIRSDRERQARYLARQPQLPGKRYGVCDWPKPCVYRQCCWEEEETTPGERGREFVSIKTPAEQEGTAGNHP